MLKSSVYAMRALELPGIEAEAIDVVTWEVCRSTGPCSKQKKRKCTDADAQVVHVRDTGLVKPDARSAVAVTLAKCEEMAALDRRPTEGRRTRRRRRRG